MFRGLRANNTPRQTPLRPKRRPPRPQPPVFTGFAEVVCTLCTTPTKATLGLPPNGGNGVIRDPTRRRHAASQPLMLQNPHRNRRGGHRATSAPKAPPVWRAPEGPRGRAAGRGPWAAGPDNEPKRRSKLAARTAEAGGTDTTASQISHAIPPQHESTQAQKPQNIND